MMKANRNLCLVLVSLPLVTYAQATGGREEVVDRLARASHGIFAPQSGPDVGKLLDEVRREPAAYAPLLLRRLEPQAIAAGDAETARQASNAAAALAAAGDEAAKQALVERLKLILSTADQLEADAERRGRTITRRPSPELQAIGRRVNQLRSVESGVITALGAVRDPRLRDLLLDRIEKSNYSFQLQYVQYLERTAARDPEVRRRLRPLLDRSDLPISKYSKLRELVGGATGAPR